MKRIIPISIIFIMLSGCMVGPKFHNPGWKTEDKYRFSRDTINADTSGIPLMVKDTIITRDSTGITSVDTLKILQWWEIYNDTVLQSIIRTALSENQDIKIAVSRIIEAQFVVGYHKADLFPGFDYHASGSILNKTNSDADESGTLLRDNFSGFAMVNWELDIWGKYRHATKAAKAQLMASEDFGKSLTTSMVAQVATLYFQLRSLDEQLDIAKNTLLVRKEATRIITEKFNGGEVAELDKFQAQSQEAITAALVPNLERQIAQTENALSILIGKNPGYIKRGLDNASQKFPVSIPEGIPSKLLARRPDVKQAEDMWMSQNERIGVAQAMRFPSISLTGIFGAASQELTNITENGSLIAYAMGSISGPIFYFGKNKRRVDIERQKTEQARLNYEKTVLNAFAEVENALISVDTYKREYEARCLQSEASHGAAVLSRERYDAGYTTFLEVLDNNRTELDAMLQAAQALQLHLQSTVQLYKALGGGWE